MMVLKFVIKNEYLKKFKLTDYKNYAHGWDITWNIGGYRWKFLS